MSEPARAPAELINEFLGSLQVERGASPNTLLAYRRDLAGFEGFLIREHRGLDAVAVTDLSRYLGALRRRGLGSRSIARHLSAVRGLYRFLLDGRRIARDPTEHLDSPRPTRAGRTACATARCSSCSTRAGSAPRRPSGCASRT